MNLLQRVRNQYHGLTAQPKAISHRPDLAGREHLYRQGAGTIVQALDTFADYATVYGVYVWVQKAIAKIAENLAGLPVRVVDSSGKALETHPLTLLLAHVNEEETPLDLTSAYVIHMMLGGETFYEIVPDGRGRPAELWLRRPDRVSVVPDVGRLNYPRALGYLVEPDEATAGTLTIEAKYMAHDKFYNPLNPWRGLAPINAVREGITIDLFAQAWSKSFLRDNARPDFAIVAPQGITKTERDRYLSDFMLKHQGVENAHLPVILEEGVTDIKAFSFPPKDIEWLQQREYSRDQVGAIFGVPDEIMGYGKDTYENFQTALEVFWTLTLLPIIRRRDMTLTHHFSRYQLGLEPGQRFDTDLSGVGVLREDLTPKIDQARKFWEMGVPFNTLDTALKLGIGPVDGGEVGYLASTYKTVEQVTNPPEPPPALLPANGQPPRDDMPAGDMPEMDDEDEDEPVVRFILPPGAKEQAKRALKRIIQQYQDGHLRALRTHQLWDWHKADDAELRRWMGDRTDAALLMLKYRIGGMGGDHDTVNAAYNALKSDESLTKLLEVEAATAFFPQRVTLPKAITPSWVKAMVLQLDDSDDEAERAIRLSLDRRTSRSLTQVFNDMLDTLYPEGYGEFRDPNIEAQRVRRLFEEEQRLYDTLSRALQDGADLGVSVAVNQLENTGYGFDWTLANVEAREWASRYTGELIRGISDTTQSGVRQAVARFIDNGEPLETLIDDLRPYFSRARAERIAITEVTRAYQQGNETAWKASGVVAEMEWVTNRDEKVCIKCGPMDKQRAPLGGTFAGGIAAPPRHVRCRCFTRPVVKKANE